MLIIVAATRLSKEEFPDCPLGRSVQRMNFDRTFRLGLVEGNEEGLPKAYNRFLSEKLRGHEVVFLHDDVWIDDVFFCDRIRTALETFDLVGLAGNRRLAAGATAWHVHGGDPPDWDHEFLSGIVCHGPQAFGEPVVFGPAPAAVQLLDGVMLAARVSTLLDAGVRFDERFDFHFYDMDLSRQANVAGLKVGTWPIALTHVSRGSFGTEAWTKELEVYRAKWGQT